MVINPVSIGTRPAPVAEATGGCGCGGCGCGAGEAQADVAQADVAQAGEVTTTTTTGTTASYPVEGMTCGHCVGAVTAELSAVPGVTEVSVALVADGISTVTVRSAAPLDDAVVRAAVDEAGYTLVASV